MLVLVGGVAIVAGTIGWMVWRAKHCSQQGCGVQELALDARRPPRQ